MVQYSPAVHDTFAALGDPTRRGIIERLGRADASLGDLAEAFSMTLTGVRKHVRVLEGAGLVTTRKVGRVRRCAIGPRRLEDEAAWLAGYQQMLEERMEHLGEFLARSKGARS